MALTMVINSALRQQETQLSFLGGLPVFTDGGNGGVPVSDSLCRGGFNDGTFLNSVPIVSRERIFEVIMKLCVQSSRGRQVKEARIQRPELPDLLQVEAEASL